MKPVGTRRRDASLRRGRAIIHFAAQILAVAILGWTVWWLRISFNQWSHDHACGLFAGPFLPCGPGRDAWKQPLLIGLLPLTGVGLWCTTCFLIPRRWRKG